MIICDAEYEGGCLDRAVKLGENFYALELRQDTWYYFNFRVHGCCGREIIFQFTCRDIHQSPEQSGGRDRWYFDDGTLVYPVYSYDGKSWQPVEHMEMARELKGTFRFRHTFIKDQAYIAFGHPYTYSDLLSFLDQLSSPRLSISAIGKSRNEVEQPSLTFSAGKKNKAVLLISREDADEITGSFAVEGMINHLLSDAPEVEQFFREYDLYLIPMVCVDGVIAGATHSAGYGYGGMRWHENPAPREIENVKNFVRELSAGGVEFVLAGKIHGGMTMQKVHPIDCVSPDRALLKSLYENRTEYWAPVAAKADASLAIRPQGFFERFMLDEFGLTRCFGVHVQGTSAGNLRACGCDLLKAVLESIERG